MDADATLWIGGLSIAVRPQAADLFPAVTGPAATFWGASPPARPTAVVAVDWAATPDPAWRKACAPLFASGGMWTLYRASDGGHYYEISSPVFGPQPYRTAWFDAEYQTGWVAYRPDPAVRRAIRAPLEYPLDELLTTNLLARGRGVELHACAVADVDGRGFLFVGQSGDGKTTTARLWSAAGATILSDDRVIVRKLRGQWVMFGTPWHGEAVFARPDSAPLTRVFVLRHGDGERATALTRAQAAALLFARAFPPFYNAAAVDFTLELLGRLAGERPCEALAFTPTPTAVDYVRRLRL
ncbi:MAG: hypothetical protein CFK52_12375 [Chloracidobacterium sp. CP2_5A]|nr:MAG: hypothetical protein CFK52_12375 [Chloracidobacterium sp. CP2_5A]